jgi:hypothetical protein
MGTSPQTAERMQNASRDPCVTAPSAGRRAPLTRIVVPLHIVIQSARRLSGFAIGLIVQGLAVLTSSRHCIAEVTLSQSDGVLEGRQFVPTWASRSVAKRFLSMR